MKYGLFFILACVWVSCNSPKTKADTAEMETKADQEDGLQIGDYVVETFQDSQGNIWLGRDGYGASKFDGTIFAHFTINEGLNSNNVTKGDFLQIEW